MNERMKIQDFTDLNAWKYSHQAVISTYKLTGKFPKDERFGLTNQMRRACVSITSNIAEGFGRNTYKERAQFYIIARGYLSELKNQLLISKDLEYTSVSEYDTLQMQLNTAHQLLQGLISKTQTISNSLHTS